LDHRAAAYEKLGEHKKALRDGKKMIEEMPGGSRGYLRSGKILELMEKPDLALQIYELGLKRVKIGEDDKRPVR
jgi:F-box/TPR repeat protein Pof3